jgi:hypothetical protein
MVNSICYYDLKITKKFWPNEQRFKSQLNIYCLMKYCLLYTTLFLPVPFPKPSSLLCYTRRYFDNQRNISYSFIQSGERTDRSTDLSSLSNSICVPAAAPQGDFAVQTVKQRRLVCWHINRTAIDSVTRLQSTWAQCLVVESKNTLKMKSGRVSERHDRYTGTLRCGMDSAFNYLCRH